MLKFVRLTSSAAALDTSSTDSGRNDTSVIGRCLLGKYSDGCDAGSIVSIVE